MEFCLTYEGLLRSNGKSKEKQRLRRAFHPQLSRLWSQLPLSEHRGWLLNEPVSGSVRVTYDDPITRQVGPFRMAPLVSQQLRLVAELHVDLFRAQEPGKIVSHGGDIDNRLKTLFDSLRMPSADEIPKGDMPGADEDPFFCVLEDDILVTALSVTTQRLLTTDDPERVFLVLRVKVRPTMMTMANSGLCG